MELLYHTKKYKGTTTHLHYSFLNLYYIIPRNIRELQPQTVKVCAVVNYIIPRNIRELQQETKKTL